MESIRHGLIAHLLVACFAMGGCAKYTSRGARTEQLPKGAGIGISVIQPDSAGGELTVLEAYLTAGLVGKGFNVRSLRLEMLAGESLIKRIFPDRPYTGTKSWATGMKRGGEMEAEPEFIKELLANNEVKDAQTRMSDLVKLTEKLPAEWGVEYMLVVHQFDVYGFASYIVHLPDRKVINAFVISGNKWGYQVGLGRPKTGTVLRASDEPNDVTRLRYLRLAEYIVSNL